MYVNIKILAAFPWFQALNILVILSLTVRRQQWLYRTTSDALHKKASWIPKPSVLSNIPRSALRFTASGASKASLALLFATRTLHFRMQGGTGRDTGIGLDMYVVFNHTPPLLCVVHAGDSERPLDKLTRTWYGSGVASAGGRLVLPATLAALARSLPAAGPGSLQWPVGRKQTT